MPNPENFQKIMQDNNVKPISINTSPRIERNVNWSEKLAVHISTQILPGKKIEISSPELPVGEAVDVFIVVPQTSSHSLLSTINKHYNKEQHLLGSSSASKYQSDIMVTIEALEALGDYLTPEPGSVFEEMLNDALEGQFRVEAIDLQEKMLAQHHAKKYIEQAIATLQRLKS